MCQSSRAPNPTPLCRHHSVSLMKSLPSVAATRSGQNTSDVILITFTGSSPTTFARPLSSPEADGRNGPGRCSREWADYDRSQFTSGSPNKPVAAATIHLWGGKNQIGGEERSWMLNQTQTGLRRGAGASGRRRLLPPLRSLPLARRRHPSNCPAVAAREFHAKKSDDWTARPSIFWRPTSSTPTWLRGR